METTKLITKLTNFEIKELKDKNFNTFYLIVNRENEDEAYFCFERMLKETGWDILTRSPAPISIEIEYEESRVTKEDGKERVYRRATYLSADDDNIII
ncbi:protein of unknown function [endosymbiont DhMRE of Dentiscutata heterogama]|uniref:hypothetical protein n=1 Tax=endosymbiont DhMRE of Dentiscutata heterogama TaxID=1609546 RepID=UPI000629DAAA|nr:hypothetical protein [endosymbiont DhMRE of Dentiscutata heterogama]CFW92924.1 protein of unknown function [endosymbiont DhMRE of Dentiscutata heterogama]